MQFLVDYYCNAWIFLDGYFISTFWEFAATVSKVFFSNPSVLYCPLVYSGETSPGVLHPALGPPTQEKLGNME